MAVEAGRPPLRLHDYPKSSAAYRVRIALALKGLAYDRVRVDLLEGAQQGAAHRAVNPLGLVPVLEADGVMLTQSLAIIEWLDAEYPDPPLLPTDPLARAQVRAQAMIVACDIHPIDNLRVLKRLESQFGADGKAKVEWMAHWMAQGFAALEEMSPGTPFLGGDAPGLADICLVPQLYNARRWSVALDAYPYLTGVDERCTALPAFAAAHPDHD